MAFRSILCSISCAFLIVALLWGKNLNAQTNSPESGEMIRILSSLSSYGDRSTGTSGCGLAAGYIQNKFKTMGIDTVGTQLFSLPILTHHKSRLKISSENKTITIRPMFLNVLSPGTVAESSIKGPLIYVGNGELHWFNHKKINGAVILMDLNSGKNWENAVNLGARALIYLDKSNPGKPLINSFFKEKLELSPLVFPRFYLPLDVAREVWGPLDHVVGALIEPRVEIVSDTGWETREAENIYGLIPGTDPKLKDELLIVEAFYDSTAMVAGKSPGADEALSITSLLMLGEKLKQHPPLRSVLLIATAGHAQTLTGMREMIWALATKSKVLKKMKNQLKQHFRNARAHLKCLESYKGSTAGHGDLKMSPCIQAALRQVIKTRADRIARRLLQLRLAKNVEADRNLIRKLAAKRLELRRLDGTEGLTRVTAEERILIEDLLPEARLMYQAISKDIKKRLTFLEDAKVFRDMVFSHKEVSCVSLHLSSHGDGIGAFNKGGLYRLKPEINRIGPYLTLDEQLHKSADIVEDRLGLSNIYIETLLPNRSAAWGSYLPDRPQLGGEVSALAGYLGVSLVTTNDARPRWGTPFDQLANVDIDGAELQIKMAIGLTAGLAKAPHLYDQDLPRSGFSTIHGRIKFLRHGELFPEQPAQGVVILGFQGDARFLARSDQLGNFYLKGVADKKYVLDKVILEGYRFDQTTGAAVWAMDKKLTGKPAYRIKIRRSQVETDIVMFVCRQTTLFNLQAPRNFNYLTKIRLFDSRHDALPRRYWYSRIDTRASTLCSIFLEPQTAFKLTLSDSILNKKMILTNATKDQPTGKGYLIDNWPLLTHTEFRAARDMWYLIGPRIENLERHGIFNQNINNMEEKGIKALNNASKALKEKIYDRFFSESAKAWALAGRVYNDVEKTQKDVLFGVLFYIALFVPFAFCSERLFFAYADIHKRILAFLGILLTLIVVVYNVHPAFELAYSPSVVILAFFIMGLSMVVTLIIFFRFEDEMKQLQTRAQPLASGEMGRFKAFAASFLIGVSNLRRRPLRTALTCSTLVILTFTIMSFTTVKSAREYSRLFLHGKAQFKGFLLKKFNWRDLPPEASGMIARFLDKNQPIAPRAWLESFDKMVAGSIAVRRRRHRISAHAIIGLTSAEAQVSGFDHVLVQGRWFEPHDRQALILSDKMAAALEIPVLHSDTKVRLWGMEFRVIGVFSADRFKNQKGLDGETLTPVIFPSEATSKITEVEADAMESGEDVMTFQSRYQHIDPALTLILPFHTVMACGGHVKAVAGRYPKGKDQEKLNRQLLDRFGVTIFSSEDTGVYLCHAGDTLKYSGVSNIAIPLLLAICIVLNTMIGSVYERKREIGIYTSVGLAPSHVSFLFIAEALSFAVLSVVTGYLLAQSSARLLSGTALWSGITVNYSSLSGIGAMLLVMMVVLLSSLYPSRVAAEIAIPDVNRAWKLPEAMGDVMDVTLPFLMRYQEYTKIGDRLMAYFGAHQDISHGLFSTGRISYDVNRMQNKPDPLEIEPNSGAGSEKYLQLNTQIWLAPFDLGIMQQVNLFFQPAEESPGFLEVRVRLIRRSGELGVWKRINKEFINVLRKQFLIWRASDGEV